MSLVLSIDPGKHAHGCALWESGELTSAWYQRDEGWEKALEERIGWFYAHLAAVVYEFPRVYPQSRSRGGLKGQNDLLDLAFSAGRAVEAVSSLGGAPRLVRYEPREWKGTAPKEIMIERFKERLSEDERDRVELPTRKDLRHNVWDGVGVGLYYWRRL